MVLIIFLVFIFILTPYYLAVLFVYKKNKFKDAKESEEYYKKLGEEIDQAFKEGRLEKEFALYELVEKTAQGNVQDSFRHEQYLVISQGGKKYLLSGCAHNGVLNILEKYKGSVKPINFAISPIVWSV